MNRSMPALLALVLSSQGCTATGVQERPRRANTAAAAPAAPASAAASRAATQAGTPAQQPPARKAPPRRAVWQDIGSMPPAPPLSSYQTLPVPQPSPMPAPPPPPSFPVQCGPAGCARPDGTRLQGQGGTLLDPSGRPCVQGPVTVQCF